MNPLMCLALAPPEEASLDDLQGIGFQVDQDKQQQILWGRQWTVLVGGVLAGRARLPIEAPLGHMGLVRGLKARHQLLKLLSYEAGQIQQFSRASLQIGEP
jgi:hypothetical protein